MIRAPTAVFTLGLALGCASLVDGPADRRSAADRAPAPTLPVHDPAPGLQTYLDTILGRNLFDATVLGVGVNVGARATGPLTLLATAVTDPDFLSSAVLLDTTTADLPGTYAVGAVVHERTLVAIDDGSVRLRRVDGSIEVLACANGPAVGAAPPAVRGPGGAGGPDEVPVVSRAELAALDPAALAEMGRAQVHRGPDGKPDGFRLSALRADGLPHTLGLRNGDVVHALNGVPIRSAADAMNAATTLLQADQVCADVTRRGKRKQRCVTVR